MRIYLYMGREIIHRGSDLWEVTVYIPETGELRYPIMTGSSIMEFLQKNRDKVEVYETETHRRVYGNHYKGPHIFCPLCGGTNMFPDPRLYGVGRCKGWACYDCTLKRKREIDGG